jgi:hypothetical protein
MVDKRYLLMCAGLWFSLSILGNWLDGLNYVTADDMQDIQDMNTYQEISSPDALGVVVETIQSGINGFVSGLKWIRKFALADFSIFYNYDASTGTLTENPDWLWFRYLLWILGGLAVLEVLAMLWQRR